MGAEITLDDASSESFYRLYPFHRHFTKEDNIQLKHRGNIIYDSVRKCNKFVVHSDYCSGKQISGGVVCNKMCSDVVQSR